MARTRGWLVPPPVNQGEAVAIIAPASPPPIPETIDKAVDYFERMGLKIVLGKYTRKRLGFLAGTDKERLHDLHWAINSKKIRAIVCVRGGYGITRILPRIDLSPMRSDPKLVIGFSDVTALHAALGHLQIASVHGPMPNALVEDGFPPFSTKGFFEAITLPIDRPRSIFADDAPDRTLHVIRRGSAKGRLAGGNLTMLCSLIGTPYFPDLRGKIVALEEIGEPPYRIDRMITHLVMAGVFDGVRGIALGIFKNCEVRSDPSVTEYRQSLIDVLVEKLSPIKIPIIYGLPFGHVPKNGAVPLGVTATLIAGTSSDLVIGEPTVKKKRAP